MRRVGIEAEESIMTAKRTDHGICVYAMREARRILNEYVEPGSAHDAVATLEQLLEVLDDRGPGCDGADRLQAIFRCGDGRLLRTA
jgi:hypothetical protein